MPNHEICFLSATELARRIRAKELSATEVMEAHLAQIERVNPKVNALVTFLPEQALEQARVEIFKVWRAWCYELVLSELLEAHRDKLIDSVIWNIEEGMKLSGTQIGEAERKRTEFYHRVRKFMETYEFLMGVQIVGRHQDDLGVLQLAHAFEQATGF
jgi:Asp-tRNA(Asn)/Glu-tRNA(Gln) amidotransferase A subunit family amidase